MTSKPDSQLSFKRSLTNINIGDPASPGQDLEDKDSKSPELHSGAVSPFEKQKSSNTNVTGAPEKSRPKLFRRSSTLVSMHKKLTQKLSNSLNKPSYEERVKKQAKLERRQSFNIEMSPRSKSDLIKLQRR